MTKEEQIEVADLAQRSVNVIYTRLFVAAEVKKLNIQIRWQAAVNALEESHDGNAFGDALNGIMDDIVSAAGEEFSGMN